MPDRNLAFNVRALEKWGPDSGPTRLARNTSNDVIVEDSSGEHIVTIFPLISMSGGRVLETFIYSQ